MALQTVGLVIWLQRLDLVGGEGGVGHGLSFPLSISPRGREV